MSSMKGVCMNWAIHVHRYVQHPHNTKYTNPAESRLYVLKYPTILININFIYYINPIKSSKCSKKSYENGVKHTIDLNPRVDNVMFHAPLLVLCFMHASI